MALINMMGEDEYLKYQKQVVMTGQVKKLPKKLQVQFLFSNIDFIWDKTNKAFVSQTLLPLIICGSKEINKVVPGRIVIEKRGSRNKLISILNLTIHSTSSNLKITVCTDIRLRKNLWMPSWRWMPKSEPSSRARDNHRLPINGAIVLKK
jgi:hypothetical protein